MQPINDPKESKFPKRSGQENRPGASSWTNGRPWTPEEEDELREMASTQTIPTIAKSLGRSEMSVRLKLKSLHFEYQDLAGFKTKDLAAMISVTVRQVRRWRRKGYLVGINGRITEESFLKFCKTYSDKIPYRSLDVDAQLWLRGYGYKIKVSPRESVHPIAAASKRVENDHA
jgi:hypothetical protein